MLESSRLIGLWRIGCRNKQRDRIGSSIGGRDIVEQLLPVGCWNSCRSFLLRLEWLLLLLVGVVVQRDCVADNVRQRQECSLNRWVFGERIDDVLGIRLLGLDRTRCRVQRVRFQSWRLMGAVVE